MAVLERPHEIRAIRPPRIRVRQRLGRATTLVIVHPHGVLHRHFVHVRANPEPRRTGVVGRIVHVILPPARHG